MSLADSVEEGISLSSSKGKGATLCLHHLFTFTTSSYNLDMNQAAAAMQTTAECGRKTLTFANEPHLFQRSAGDIVLR